MTVRDGVVSERSWRQVARLVQDIMSPGELDQIVLMRDVEAKAASSIDPRWIVETLRRQFPNAYTYLVEGSVGTTSKLTVGVSKSLITSRVLTHSPPPTPITRPCSLRFKAKGLWRPIMTRSLGEPAHVSNNSATRSTFPTARDVSTTMPQPTSLPTSLVSTPRSRILSGPRAGAVPASFCHRTATTLRPVRAG